MSAEKFDAWAIVELFGHQRIAGRVTEESIGGCSFVRVDVPAVGGNDAWTKLLGQGSIYGINLVTEEVARAAAASIRKVPVSSFDLPELRQARLPYSGEPTEPDFSEVDEDHDGEPYI